MPSKSDLLDTILWFAYQGYAVFPTRGKEPIKKGVDWTKSQPDFTPSIENYPFGEYGIVLKPEDLIVDIDPRNFPDKRKVWHEFKTMFAVPDAVEKSRVFRSGSGGLHLWLRKPAEFVIRKKLPAYPGLDFLTEGSYIIGPHSNVKGLEYTILQNVEPLDAPKQILNALIRQVEEFSPITEGFRDTEGNKRRFEEFLRLQDPAVEGRGGDLVTFRAACRGRDFNLSQEACFEIMFRTYNPRCMPPWSSDDLRTKIRNAYTYNEVPPGKNDPFVVLPNLGAAEEDPLKWMVQLDRKKTGEYTPSLKNAVLFLRNDKNLAGSFSFNLFNYKIEISGKMPWEALRVNNYRIADDLEIGHLGLYFATTYNIEFPPPKLWEAVAIVAGEKARHPLREMLNALTWDGVPRLDRWLTRYCGVMESDYSRAVGRKTLMAAVARVFEPGIKFDNVLVLEGAQGVGKSTICRILGGEYFGDAPLDIHNIKDAIQYVHAHWIIEFAEMVSVRKAEVNKLKGFISAQEDEARPAYARAAKKFARQSIFIGTINPDDVGYLVDDTGNRRYWPVLCQRCDLSSFRRDRDQILAEAVFAYKKGEDLHLEGIEEMAALHETRQRMVKDPWTDIVSNWAEQNQNILEVTTEMIYTTVIGGSYLQFQSAHARRIAAALRLSGFVAKATAKGVKYVRPILHLSEAESVPKDPFTVKILN